MGLIGSFIIGLTIMLFLMIKTKIGPFVSMLFGALIIGIGGGVNATETINTITTGFGNTCKSIGIIIIFGTILGEYLEKSNASQRIATTLLKLTGEKNASVALSATGYLVSIPVFSDVAMIMLSPLCKSISKKAKIMVGPLAVALALGLLNTNAFVAPTPAPLAIVAILGIDIGESILYGLIVAMFATFCGLVFAKYLSKKPAEWYSYSEIASDIEQDGAQEAASAKFVSEAEMPSFIEAILPILAPIILIVFNTVCNLIFDKKSNIVQVANFIGNSNIALAIGIIIAVLLLKKRLPKGAVYQAINNSLKIAGPVIFITAAGGSLAKVIDLTGVGKLFADALAASSLPIILIPFLICGLSKFAQGSGSVAMIMAATLSVPLVKAGLISPIIAFLTICAGSSFGSHVNNSFFWVFVNLFGFDTKTGLKTLVVGQHVIAIAGLIGTFALSFVI